MEVVARGERPSIDDTFAPAYAKLIDECWDNDPDHRPSFEAIVPRLDKQLDTIHSETVVEPTVSIQ